MDTTATDVFFNFLPQAFRANDIRGVVPDVIDTPFAHALGVTIGVMTREDGARAVVVGRDVRSSSVELSAALQAGIRATGTDVIDIGMATSAQVYFAAWLTDAGAAISVTGSHHTAAYNGFKIMRDGEMLCDEDMMELSQRMGAPPPSAEVAGKRSRFSVDNCYQARILSDVRLSRSMKIAVDCGNGAAGILTPDFLRTLGCEVVELFCDIDGAFPNHSLNPSDPANLRDLVYCLRYTDCELGLAFDSDASRLGVVAKSGRIIWPDEQMVLFARDLLARRSGAKILYDVQCGRHLRQAIVQAGGEPIMWKSGYALMRAKMRETGALLGGERSGHFFFAERWFGFDDGLYAAARLLEILSRAPDPQALLEALPRSCVGPEIRLRTLESEKFALIDALRQRGKFKGALSIFDLDGLRVEYADGFGLVRASNTTAELVLRFEADNAVALARIQKRFRKQLLRVAPHLKLPF